MLTLFMTLIFTSCQVKDSSSDELTSGHAPTTNKFTLVTPSSKTYVAGEKITLNVTFPFDIVADTTGGSPRLRLTVGAATVHATSVASADPQKLTFEYTFLAGQNDTNGIDVVALELNGSTLKFDKDGVMTDCNVASITTKNFSGVKVDTAGPTITGFALTTAPSATTIHGTGKVLTFTMTFSEKVNLVGTTPEFDILFDTGTGTAVYTMGTGTTTLTFEYTVTSSVNDINGYNDFSALDIGTGTIKDDFGNDANLTFTALEAAVRTYSASVKIGGQYPSVVAVTFPANKTYVVAEDLDFTFEFDREVNVTGTPYLDITVSGATPSARQAQYVSEPGPTKFVTFRYTTVPGDVDADGITVASSINNDGGTAFIRDDSAPNNNFLTAGYNSYTVPSTTGIILNALQPQAITVTRNVDITNSTGPTTTVDNVWNIGQVLNITVGFNTPVFVDQTLGTPSLPLTIGSTTVQAPYLSGSGQANLIFRYTIQEGDLDTDGSLAIGNLQLNGGNIVDAQTTNILLTMPVASLTTTRVDGVRPTLTSVTAPANQVYSNVTTYSPQYTRTELIFNANWSEAVHYSSAGSISMTVNGTARNLQSYNNDTSVITHRPTTTFPTNVEVGIVVGSSITGTSFVVTDLAGNTATATTFSTPDVSGISVDTLAPTVTSITPISASATYKANETIDFDVTFSESVTVARNANYPRIQMNVGGTTRYMIATTNGTGTSHTYRHTATNPDVDTDGVNSVNVHQNSGTTLYARDAGRNPATVAVNQNFAGYNVDTVAPTISVATSANGTYETGDVLEFRLTYSEPMTVDDNGGVDKPRIAVTIGSNLRYFEYNSMVGNVLYFRYTLAADDFDPNGLPTSIDTLDLNGGTIEDAGGNATPTTFTAQNLSQIFVMFSNTTLWFQTGATNKAKTPAAVTYSGTVGALDNCGAASNCRRFNGDDSLSGTINDVQTLFIAFKAPPTEADYPLFGANVTLEDNGINFNVQVVGANSTSLDGAAFAGQTAIAVNQTYVLQANYTAEDFSGAPLLGPPFDGSLGEVIAVTGALTPTQKDTIRNYLLGRFP